MAKRGLADSRSPLTASTSSQSIRAVRPISSYRIQPDGSLAYLSSTAFKSGTGIAALDARLDPAGRNLYMVDAHLNAVSAFAVSGGTLTELPSSPFALLAGAAALGSSLPDHRKTTSTNKRCRCTGSNLLPAPPRASIKGRFAPTRWVTPT